MYSGSSAAKSLFFELFPIDQHRPDRHRRAFARGGEHLDVEGNQHRALGDRRNRAQDGIEHDLGAEHFERRAFDLDERAHAAVARDHVDESRRASREVRLANCAPNFTLSLACNFARLAARVLGDRTADAAHALQRPIVATRTARDRG